MSTLLTEADKVIAERGVSYEHPHENFARIAEAFNLVLADKLSQSITREDVGLMMIGLKLAREVGCHKRDNLLDIAGYAKCLDMVHGLAVPGQEEPSGKIVEESPANDNECPFKPGEMFYCNLHCAWARKWAKKGVEFEMSKDLMCYDIGDEKDMKWSLVQANDIICTEDVLYRRKPDAPPKDECPIKPGEVFDNDEYCQIARTWMAKGIEFEEVASFTCNGPTFMPQQTEWKSTNNIIRGDKIYRRKPEPK